MPRKAKSANKADLSNYLSLRLGITRNLSARVINVVAEYITINLAKGLSIVLPKIGTIAAVKVKDLVTVKFRVSPVLKTQLINESKQPYARVIKLRYTSTVPNKTQQLRDRVANNVSSKILKSMGARSYASGNTIRMSLLRYLQQGLPYGVSWEHPITKEEYSAEYLLEKVNILRELNPILFRYLTIMWVGHESKAIRAKQIGVCERTLVLNWYKAADRLIALIVFKDELTDTMLKYLI